MARHALINKQNVRRFILEYAGRSRSHKYTQVGASVYDQIELAIRERCRKIVNQQPSAGRTIK
ncbi:MAG: hypothetical protein ISS31_06500 [Kiritimatiellae bacterium]|nr:hypothetical protein [Kiritimatiellia bacterium]